MGSVHDFSAEGIDGDPVRLSDYAGRVLLIVNVASECGFTPQYAGLQRLWRDYHDRGLVVLGFPCDQFGGQEPGDGAEILAFCSRNYGVDFPMFAKVEVNGPGAHPLWAWLTRQRRGLLGSRAVKWNFSKFLVGRDGRVLGRYGPMHRPQALRGDIEAALSG